MKTILAFTDGACSGNPGPGGWGFRLIYGKHVKDSSGFGGMNTTNNRMEMMAVIECLRALKEKCCVKIFSDSKYVVDGVNKWSLNWKKNGWKKKQGGEMVDVANQDLWIALDYHIEKHDVILCWIKGHDGWEHNEAVDKLAVEACQQGIDDNIEEYHNNLDLP